MNLINRKHVLLFLVLISSFLSQGQTFEAIKSKGFDLEVGTPTGTSIKVEGKGFELFTTSKGSKYIKCLSSRTGNYYPVWIGKKTELTHEGKTIYQSKSGKYCIYALSKIGYPYPIWLKKKQ